MSGGIDDGYSESEGCICEGPRAYKKKDGVWICEDCGKPELSGDEPREIER